MDVSGNIAWSLKYRTKGIVAIETTSALIVGVYVSPNVEHIVFISFMDRLQRIIVNTDKRLILLGEFNSKSIAAGSNYTNRRGEVLDDLMETARCHCINDNAPTYKARGHSSVLDLTILDNRWRSDQWEWKVLPD
ncbi:uncharacterized protein LOC142322632 [Lycorma delicatula]|uniref:uncharacterized protein LOC142322632 n=1 Tax=Lycorma delicatula TaxID=130591 RepID=UPI003F50E92A